MTTTDREVADHHAAGAMADELPYWGWLPDDRTCLTPEQLGAVLNRWQRMLSGIDARTRMYFYLLRRPATFPDADTGLSAVAALGQRKRRAFLGSRIQQIDTFVAWCLVQMVLERNGSTVIEDVFRTIPSDAISRGNA